MGLADAVQLLTGLALIAGYALLGASWLVMKTEGALATEPARSSWWLLFAMLGAIGAVSIATPFLHVQYAQPVDLAQHRPDRAGADRGRGGDRTVVAARWPPAGPPAVLSDARAVRAVVCRTRHQHVAVYRAAEHHDLQVASTENSQIFMLFGVAVLMPLILGYTAWAYWVFRGKVSAGSGYH